MGRPLNWLGSITLLLGTFGCRLTTDQHPLAEMIMHTSDNLAARASFLKWNMRTALPPTDGLTGCSRALELAGRSGFDLDSLMARQPAPPVEMLAGRWHGINKGVGAAVIGLTQDIKVFSVRGTCLTGHNVAVYQVSIDELACRGFQPRINALTGCEKTMGNFIIQPPCAACQPLKLDYTQADNSLADPSRSLVDELVMIDHDMLLGKAYTKVGQRMMPLAFFVLFRADLSLGSSQCDGYGQDSSQPPADINAAEPPVTVWASSVGIGEKNRTGTGPGPCLLKQQGYGGIVRYAHVHHGALVARSSGYR